MSLPDEFKRMATFRAVVDAGSFAAAARELDLTRAAVSKQVQRLEDYLGVTLLLRTSRRLRLTEAGARFYTGCRDMIEAAAQAVSAAQHLSTGPRGTLRVSAALGVGVHFIAPGLADFCRRYPELDVDLILDDTQVDPLQEPFDLVIRAGELPDSGLRARRLTGFEMVVCASPAYTCTREPPSTPAELANHEFVSYTPLGNKMKLRFVHRTSGERATVEVAGRVRTNNADVIAELVTRGYGLGLFPIQMVAARLANGELRALLGDWQVPTIPVFAVYPAAEHLPKKLRCFIDFYASRLQP